MDITAIVTHESKLKHLLLQTIRELRPDGWEAITERIVLSEIRSFSFGLTLNTPVLFEITFNSGTAITGLNTPYPGDKAAVKILEIWGLSANCLQSVTISAQPDSLVRWRGTGIIGVPE
jgi:hypothetical protein